ncbi:MAG: TIGR02646 family protein [Lentisphaerae bacterium]|jgi:uncharacterized protein (TIGR02646 family)|nr:TIGR02646 family protein [Lentisphaerota bacterium]
MKHINKSKEPDEFEKWKALANEEWQPCYSNLDGKTKRHLKDSLMREQGYICCYCERRLIENDSHIEHLRPQSDYPDESLNYSNLLCSCLRDGRKGEPIHCGHSKGDWFDETLLVSPLDPSCESRFAYGSDGTIGSADPHDKGVAETIARLGLNIPKLNEMRANAIAPFLDATLSDSEFYDFVAGYLRTDPKSGYFGEFWTTIKWLFGAVCK